MAHRDVTSPLSEKTTFHLPSVVSRAQTTVLQERVLLGDMCCPAVWTLRPGLGVITVPQLSGTVGPCVMLKGVSSACLDKGDSGCLTGLCSGMCCGRAGW